MLLQTLLFLGHVSQVHAEPGQWGGRGNSVGTTIPFWHFPVSSDGGFFSFIHLPQTPTAEDALVTRPWGRLASSELLPRPHISLLPKAWGHILQSLAPPGP